MSAQGQPIDTAAIDPANVTKLVSAATEDQLREVMTGPQRDQIVAEVFRRMGEHYKPGVAADGEAVIHWKVTGRPDGREDHWEVVVRGKECTTSAEPKGDPRVTLTLDGVDFLRLVTGNAAGPELFMSGKLKIEGDLIYSASIASMFTIPG